MLEGYRQFPWSSGGGIRGRERLLVLQGKGKDFLPSKQEFSALSSLQGWVGAVTPSLSPSLARRGTVSWRFCTSWLRMRNSKSSYNGNIKGIKQEGGKHSLIKTLWSLLISPQRSLLMVVAETLG